MKKILLFIGVLLLQWEGVLYAQNEESKKIDYTSERTVKNEEKYPDALIMYKVNNQVIFTHEGIKVWCDQAIFYKEDNFFRAMGHVKMIQGDTLTLTSEYAEYDGNTRFAFASNDVHLKTPTTTLATDSLFFNRQKQEAFYRSGGVVRDTANTITSQIGRYYMPQKKYSFRRNVVVTNKDYIIHSDHIDFYTDSGQVFLFGPSTITGEESKLYCERGFYDTHKNRGYFVKNSKLFYQNRELEGDSIYFDRNTHFASATNNIKVTDTTNESTAYGHYAEVYREKDSVFITKKALIAKKQDVDSVYIHSDTIMVTGKPENRIIRAFYNAKIYKNDMNGRSDSISMNEKKGITKMLGTPVLFSDLKQLTGDTIELFNDTITNKLDSLSVYNHAFLVEKDTIDGFNQVKGKYMYGLFKNNELSEVNFVKNTETIYYYRDDKTRDLIGINKAVSSLIKILFEDHKISSIEFDQNPQNITHVPSDFPKNARKLKGFHWRGDERILNKQQLFEDDPPLNLPKIQGIPLPKENSFFKESTNHKENSLLNKKSRLDSGVLRNIETNSLDAEKDSLEHEADSWRFERNDLKSNEDSLKSLYNSLKIKNDTLIEDH